MIYLVPGTQTLKCVLPFYFLPPTPDKTLGDFKVITDGHLWRSSMKRQTLEGDNIKLGQINALSSTTTWAQKQPNCASILWHSQDLGEKLPSHKSHQGFFTLIFKTVIISVVLHSWWLLMWDMGDSVFIKGLATGTLAMLQWVYRQLKLDLVDFVCLFCFSFGGEAQVWEGGSRRNGKQVFLGCIVLNSHIINKILCWGRERWNNNFTLQVCSVPDMIHSKKRLPNAHKWKVFCRKGLTISEVSLHWSHDSKCPVDAPWGQLHCKSGRSFVRTTVNYFPVLTVSASKPPKYSGVHSIWKYNPWAKYYCFYLISETLVFNKTQLSLVVPHWSYARNL